VKTIRWPSVWQISTFSTYHVISAAGATATRQSRTAFSPSTTVTSDSGSSKNQPTHHLDVIVGYGLFHDNVRAHDMSLNIRPSDDCRRHLSVLVTAVSNCLTVLARHTHRKLNTPCIRSSNRRNQVFCSFFRPNVMPSVIALSMFVVRHGKGPVFHQLLRRHCRRAANCSHLLPATTVTDRYGKEPSVFIVHQCSRGVGKAVFSATCYQGSWKAEATEEISSKVDVREKAKHHTESSVKLYKYYIRHSTRSAYSTADSVDMITQTM